MKAEGPGTAEKERMDTGYRRDLAGGSGCVGSGRMRGILQQLPLSRRGKRKGRGGFRNRPPQDVSPWHVNCVGLKAMEKRPPLPRSIKIGGLAHNKSYYQK